MPPTEPRNPWQGLRIAIVGGDAREVEMAALATEAGAEVRLFGTPRVDVGAPVGTFTEGLGDALDGAKIAIGPIPYPGPDGQIYAPAADAPVFVTADDLRRMDAPAYVIIGKAGDALSAAADEAAVSVLEYEHDTELMLLRAPAIAEGAIAIAIQRSPWTLHDSPVGVVGFGRIARALTRSLLGLQARVHVIARAADARAEAVAYGASAHDFADAPDALARLRILFSTVPARVVTAELLEHLPSGSLVVDMSAPPGGVDREAAAQLGHDFVWARGLGASAPRTVARSQWMGVTKLASAALGGSPDGSPDGP